MGGVAVFGVTGRMGQALVRLLTAAPPAESTFGLALSGATCAPGSAACGKDAAGVGRPTGVLASDDVAVGLRGAAVAVDFSRPHLATAHAAACAAAGVPLLIGTTGFDDASRAAFAAAARTIPLLIAPNTSLGVAVMAHLVRQATTMLGPAFEVEILEAHHRLKKDAPSGTALSLGVIVAEARGGSLADVAVFDRHGSSAPREAGGIGFSVLRAADIVGEHTVMFAADGERLEITHRATDRAIFARGALRAAAWLVGRPPGLYGMHNVLGLP
jgi:4-hydroxy-tetrahydrodipicolinate reductase